MDSSEETGRQLATEAVERMAPSDITPSYESAIQVPELFIDRNSSLPAYESIRSDLVDTNTREQVQIDVPQPAVCRSRRLD